MIIGLICSTNLDICVNHEFDRSLESNSDELKYLSYCSMLIRQRMFFLQKKTQSKGIRIRYLFQLIET